MKNCKAIEVAGAKYTTIKCNLMDGNTQGFETRGLSVTGSFNTWARCNAAEEYYIGAQFHGLCDASTLLGNQMQTGYNGFLLGAYGTAGDDAWIGQQRYRGNLWLGGFSNYPAVRLGTISNLNVENRFIIDPAHPQYAQQHPAGVQPVTGWFEDILPVNQTTFSCSSSNSCPEGFGDPDFPEVLGLLEDGIANGSLEAGYCEDAVRWTAKRHLYARLKQNPALLDGNQAMQDFLSAQAGTTVGAFQTIEAQIDQLFTLGTADDALLESNRDSVAAKTAAIAAIEAQIDAGGLTLAQVAALRAQQAAEQQGIAARQDQNDGIVAGFMAQRTAMAASLLQDNSGITAVTVPEQNQKTVNSAFLQTIAVGSSAFTGTQLASLESVASQCALCGGDAVFLARSLYALADPGRKFEDGSLCAAAQPLKKPAGTTAAGPLFSLAPNPASNWMLLSSSSIGVTEGELRLADLSGREVYRAAFATEGSDGALLDVSGLAPGYYTCLIYQEGRLVQAAKLAISR